MSTSQIIQNGAKEFDVKSWINNTLSNANLLNTSPISNSSNSISTSDIDETIKSDIKSTLFHLLMNYDH
ncbi:hypothetical protein F8M41_022933 [Gigaspora margarita]|uniref:Uncharacterized protein n=1 Tax=Gigaspora margarita TaxID=4874 RepID=A0A8H4AE85_GIGMA|nr:hypothetical protein F8M41_022933 [Gigaspora margarita]